MGADVSSSEEEFQGLLSGQVVVDQRGNFYAIRFVLHDYLLCEKFGTGRLVYLKSNAVELCPDYDKHDESKPCFDICDLPIPVLQSLLRLLDFGDVRRLTQVCSKWNDTISNKLFLEEKLSFKQKQENAMLHQLEILRKDKHPERTMSVMLRAESEQYKLCSLFKKKSRFKDESGWKEGTLGQMMDLKVISHVRKPRNKTFEYLLVKKEGILVLATKTEDALINSFIYTEVKVLEAFKMMQKRDHGYVIWKESFLKPNGCLTVNLKHAFKWLTKIYKE